MEPQMNKNPSSSIKYPVTSNPHQDKILVIDDEPIIIESISYDLMNEGYEILSAMNGKEGLVLFEKEKPTVIILDIRMPVMDGIEFLEHIKLESSDPYAVIVLTGHGDDEDVQKCFNLGVSSFLRKPYNIHVLKGLVGNSIEFKHTQQELMCEIECAEQKAERLASFPMMNVNPILEVDSLRCITFYNNAAITVLNKLGVKDEEVEVFLPKDMNKIFTDLEQKRKCQLYREVVIKGSIFGENIHYVPKFNVVRIYTRDITEHRQAEEEIRKLSMAIEQSPCIVMITDTNGNIEYVNPKFTELTGYKAEEVIGKNPRILKSGELSNEGYRQLWDTIISKHEWHGEFHNKKKNGDLYWELASISVITSPDGEITNFIKVAEDITQRKLADDALTKAREELLHAEKLSSIGKLTASLAHEFNNPITGIRNTLESILEIEAGEPLDDGLLKLVQLSIGESNRMASLIKNLQDFNRPSSGIFKPDIDINSIIEAVILLNNKRLKERNITVEKNYEVEIPRISGISDQIKQVILNLIQNADEAIPGNEGKITINTLHDDSNIFIQIKDTGTGIKKELMSSIFEPFFSTKPAVKGTGLGLSISYGIIKKHGGDIMVESEVGKGSTFTIKLPIKQNKPK